MSRLLARSLDTGAMREREAAAGRTLKCFWTVQLKGFG